MIAWSRKHSFTFKVTPVHLCKTYWRSHGCNRPEGHRGKHRCECGDTPYAEDVLY